MSIFSRRPAAPQRRPHPDPRTEAALQRVLALRRAAERAEARAAEMWAEERNQRDRAAHRVKASHTDARLILQQADDARVTAQEAEEQVRQLHDDIAKQITALPDDALLWLNGAGT